MQKSLFRTFKEIKSPPLFTTFKELKSPPHLIHFTHMKRMHSFQKKKEKKLVKMKLALAYLCKKPGLPLEFFWLLKEC